jgi:hypothetical protein
MPDERIASKFALLAEAGSCSASRQMGRRPQSTLAAIRYRRDGRQKSAVEEGLPAA